MDRSVSQPSNSQDNPDEYLTPQRSPSRLDYCLEDLVGDDSSSHRLDWSSISSLDEYRNKSARAEHSLVLGIAPLTHPKLLIMEDEPPQATDSPAHKYTDPPPLFFAPDGSIEDTEVVSVPCAPIPVRPLSMQMPVDAEEPMPPISTTPKRLNYPHHGFSHSALLQQKAFWYARHEEWAEWQSRVEQGEAQNQEPDTNDAYTGITAHRVVSPPPYIRTPPSGLERDLPPRRHAQGVQGIHTSIYPRVGDISALRDPYPVNIDRSFFMFPLWTLHKALYAFDMQHGSASFATPAPAYHATPVQESMSTSTLSSYSSSTSGDDEESDSTLVADDSPVPKSQLPPEPLQTASSPYNSPSWGGFFGWGLSWYARWQVLLGIFRREHNRYEVFGYDAHSTPPPDSSPSDQVFREEDGNDDGDDEDDYGTLITDSSFHVDFNEECERALAFYSRD